MSKKTKILLSAAALLLLAAFYVITLKTAPKNASYFPFLLLLIGLDLFLWKSIHPLLRKTAVYFRIPFTILYWSPFLILILSQLSALFLEAGDTSSPFLIYLMGFVFVMYACKLIPALILLLTVILRHLLITGRRLFSRKSDSSARGLKSLRMVQYAGYGFGMILLVFLVLGMVVWGYNYQVIEQKLELSDLPEGFQGLRIVQISDLHLGTWPSVKKLEQVVNTVNSLDPDLILFTGDLVNSVTGEAIPYEGTLSQFSAPLGIFAVLGNHDYGDYASWDTPEAKEKNMTELYSYFDRIGWRLLCNRHEIVHLNGDSLAIAGVDNWSVYDRFETRGDLRQATTGLDDTRMIILLTHDPTHWEEEVIRDFPQIDLTLSGHTHGFQFGIETNRFQWSPVQWLYGKWAGIYEFVHADGRKQYLYVNRGLGAIGYPGRVGIKPEITLLVLE
ncbi:MAG TPA: metallophosphoesterase [Bacteroidales bacterium]|nr:metallophosphoesterase [Bacteroidales bacterium]HNS46231.1 metallophosphoesterase [Bacteroidales bacterium]